MPDKAPTQDKVQLKLRRLNVVPPGGFRWYCHQTAKWSKTEHNSLSGAIREAREFYAINNFPVPPDFERRIEQELCTMLGPEWCEGFDPHQPIFYGGSTQFTLDTLKTGAATLSHHIGRRIHQGGRLLVDAAEVNRRAQICATGDPTFGRCRFNRGPSECKTCGGGMEVLGKLLGRVSQALAACPETPYDSQLAGCAICQCPLRSKICVEADITLSHMPNSQKALFPTWCWVAQEIQKEAV